MFWKLCQSRHKVINRAQHRVRQMLTIAFIKTTRCSIVTSRLLQLTAVWCTVDYTRQTAACWSMLWCMMQNSSQTSASLWYSYCTGCQAMSSSSIRWTIQCYFADSLIILHTAPDHTENVYRTYVHSLLLHPICEIMTDQNETKLRKTTPANTI